MPAPRKLLFALCVAGLLGSALAAFEEIRRAPGVELDCWILPNARAALFPGSGCPLEPHQTVRRVRDSRGRAQALEGASELWSSVLDLHAAGYPEVTLEVEKAGTVSWQRVSIVPVSKGTRVARLASALLVSAMMLVLPLLVLWRSSSPAAVPFYLLYAALAPIFVTVIAFNFLGDGLQDALDPRAVK